MPPTDPGIPAQPGQTRGEDWFRDLAELSSDWFWEQDAEYRFTARLGEMHARTGLNAQTTLGKRRWELGILGVSERQWQEHRETLARHETFRDFLYQYVNQDGDMRWLTVSGKPMFDADGNFVGYRGTGRDITEQKHAEAELRESESQLRQLTDSLPAAIAYIDSDLIFRFANRRYREIFGVDPEEVVGRHLRENAGSKMYGRIEPYFKRAMAGETLSYRRTRKSAEGDLNIFNVSLVPHRDVGSRVVGCYAMTVDITDSERAAERIAGLERRFASALEATTDLMAVYRIDGARLIIELANPALCDFYERNFASIRSADWIGRPLDQFQRDAIGMTAVQCERRLEPYWRAVREGKAVRFRTGIATPGGLRQRDCLIVPLADGDGPVHHLFYRSADITDLVEKEEALRRLNADLERQVEVRTAELVAANRELEAFSYSVSHDLRAPLRGIDGYSQLLVEEHGAALGPEGTDYLRRVRRGILRMGALIDDLLRLSRVTRSPLNRTRIELSALAHDIAAELQSQAPERAVAWRIEEGVVAQADPGLMRAALENLLGNAWKYTRDSERPLIEFGASTERVDGVGVFVRDNGVGFDMAHVGKLFRPFQRLHGLREFEGSGIGLATVARIARRHGGEVRAEGATGRGATFHLFLPFSEGGS